MCGQCFQENHADPYQLALHKKEKKIAFIANDDKKNIATEFAKLHIGKMKQLLVFATSGTAKILCTIKEENGISFPVINLGHAALGDIVAAHMVYHRLLDAVVFFVDYYDMHHMHEKQALINACYATEIPLGTTMKSAEKILCDIM